MLSPRKGNKTAVSLLDVLAMTCGPGECAAAGGGPADLPRRRFRVDPFWNALSRISGGHEWSVEAVLDGLQVPSTARFQRETAGDPTSDRLWGATAELAVVSPEARGAATGGALLDAASARKRAKSASISSLVWHARTKAKSASTSASRVRYGPVSTIPLNVTRARKRLEVGATVPSFLDDDFVGAMPKSKQPCEYTTQAVRLEECPPRGSNAQTLEPGWLRCGKTHKALH